MAYRKDSEFEKKFREQIEADDNAEFARIRCPHCRWQPTPASLWFCADCEYPENFFAGCGTMWNTFETGGRCPTCAHQWRWTSCLACGSFSPHENWYQPENR
ncbi:MAG: hypothetical protein ACR2GD_08315 [Pyrinomonadaceae bacterium]